MEQSVSCLFSISFRFDQYTAYTSEVKRFRIKNVWSYDGQVTKFQLKTYKTKTIPVVHNVYEYALLRMFNQVCIHKLYYSFSNSTWKLDGTSWLLLQNVLINQSIFKHFIKLLYPNDSVFASHYYLQHDYSLPILIKLIYVSWLWFRKIRNKSIYHITSW